MPRFYFHYWDGHVLTEDSDGSEHDDVHGAYIEAFDTAEALAIDLIRNHRNAVEGRIDVVDDLGRGLFELPFSEVLAAGSASNRTAWMRKRTRTAAESVRRPVAARAGAERAAAALVRPRSAPLGGIPAALPRRA